MAFHARGGKRIDAIPCASLKDITRAKAATDALQLRGYGVWDWDIPAGEERDDFVARAIASTDCVIAFWTRESVADAKVKEPARLAAHHRKLIPVMLDSIDAPFGTGGLAAVQLFDWNGRQDHPDWIKLLDGVMRLSGRPPKIIEVSSSTRRTVPSLACLPNALSPSDWKPRQ